MNEKNKKSGEQQNADGGKTRGFFPITPSDEFLAFTVEKEDDE